jgi:phosphatidylglycerophosphatase A
MPVLPTSRKAEPADATLLCMAKSAIDRSRNMPRVDAPVSAPLWARVTATFFGIGRFRPGPGTWASLTTVVLWGILTSYLAPAWQSLAAILLAGAVIALGIPAATQVSRAMAVKDPQIVVIDEVAGQLLALVAVPVSWKSLLFGFILFRGFDIVKPPPVRQLEQLPEGLGIVVDDVAAGLYALLIMQALLHFGFLPR